MAKRVLVVAGREGVAPALQVQIELWGNVLDFSLAASGNEALWEVRGSPYDLVLAPWQLPEMTGIEFAEVVQALSPATKVVLIGVPVTPALRNRAKSLGIFALLSETSPQEVAVMVSRAMETPLPRPRPARKPEPAPPQEAPAREAPAPAQEAPGPAQEAPVVAPRQAPPKPATPSPEVALAAAQQEAVRRALQDLVISIGPQVALLISTGGDVLVAEGSPDSLDLPAVAAQAGTALSSADDLADLLQDEHQLGLFLFVGSRYDVYAFSVTEVTILLFVFDKTVVEGRLGSVWLYTRKVVDELREILA